MVSRFLIRPMLAEDILGAVSLQRACFPDPFPESLLWNADHLRKHLAVFPEGQFIAVASGCVIGSASNCIIREAAWDAHLSWDETVGGPFIENHDADGTTLYGLDVSVHPRWRQQGVMRALYGARFDLVIAGLRRYGTAVRIPGFDAYQVENLGASPEDYVQAVVAGKCADRTLTPMLRVGLKVDCVIRDYMDDPESHNAAAVLEWRP